MNHCWHCLAMERLLEVIGHIICQLSNAVKGSVSDLWVLVLQMLENLWHYRSDLLDIVDILTDL